MPAIGGFRSVPVRRAALDPTDDPRLRLISQTVSLDHVGRILAGRERGATEAELQDPGINNAQGRDSTRTTQADLSTPQEDDESGFEHSIS